MVWPPAAIPTLKGHSFSEYGAAGLVSSAAAAQSMLDSARSDSRAALALVGFSTDLPLEAVFPSFGQGPAQAPPSGIEPRLLGYDIATGSFLSGLSNCGYLAEKLGGWAQKLSTDHLLTSASDAEAFRLLTEERVPEHRPFYSIGVWLLRST